VLAAHFGRYRADEQIAALLAGHDRAGREDASR
jgi:hypothetical protein